MTNPQELKLQLVQDVINLPDDKLPRLQNYLTKLTASKGIRASNGSKQPKVTKIKKSRASKTPKLHIDHDPILDFIGLASYDPPSKSIDEELYGDL